VAITQVDVIALHCDQGMGTLVKVYDDSVMDELAYLALFDLGSDSKDWFFAGDALDTVWGSLDTKVDHKLDVLMLSHQDKDHWNLLPNLRGMISGSSWKDQFTLGQLWRGGLDWGPQATTEFNMWQTEYNVKGHSFTDCTSGYRTPGAVQHLTNYDAKVWINLVVTNVQSSRSAPDLIRNGSSMVICINFGGNRVIIPGDATSETLWAINYYWDKWADATPSQTLPIVPCVLLAVPHHGALRTIADNFDSDKPKLTIAQEFAGNVQPLKLAASAGLVASYGHPSKRVLDILDTSKKSKWDPHSYVAYVEADSKWYEYDKVTRGVYTTIETAKIVRQNIVTSLFPNGTFKYSFDVRGSAVPPMPDEYVIARPAEHFGG
jgi:hypothetical protein